MRSFIRYSDSDVITVEVDDAGNVVIPVEEYASLLLEVGYLDVADGWEG